MSTKPLICAKGNVAQTEDVGDIYMNVSIEKLKNKVFQTARRRFRSIVMHRFEWGTSEKQAGVTKDGLAPSIVLMLTAREKNHV